MASIDTLTIDEFDMLEPADHAVAIGLYSQRITQLESRLKRFNSDLETEEIMRDELRRCQNFRKLHVCKLHEQLWLNPAEALVAVATDGSTSLAA